MTKYLTADEQEQRNRYRSRIDLSHVIETSLIATTLCSSALVDAKFRFNRVRDLVRNPHYSLLVLLILDIGQDLVDGFSGPGTDSILNLI